MPKGWLGKLIADYDELFARKLFFLVVGVWHIRRNLCNVDCHIPRNWTREMSVFPALDILELDQ